MAELENSYLVSFRCVWMSFNFNSVSHIFRSLFPRNAILTYHRVTPYPSHLFWLMLLRKAKCCWASAIFGMGLVIGIF